MVTKWVPNNYNCVILGLMFIGAEKKELD